MLRYLGRTIRTYPKTTVLISIFLVLGGAGVGLYCYALHEWHHAQTAIQEGRPREARNSLDICLVVWPRNAQVHLLAARAARLTGDFEGAEGHLKQCIKLQNGATGATQLEFLLMRAQTGEEDEVADALFDLVDHKHPEASLIMETLAQAYMHRLRYGLALACLTRWIKEAPGNAKTYHWRGWVLERLDDAKSAMKDYKQALKLDPDLAVVRLRVAEMLLEDKLPNEALPHLQRLRKQVPHSAEIMARLGQCRFLQGEAKEARRLLEAAVKNLPNNPPLLLHLAKLDLLEGKPVAAEKRLRQALKVDPADVEAQYTLATSLQNQGREEEAVVAMDRCEEQKALLKRANQLLSDEAKHPTKDPDSPSEIGNLLLKMGQDKIALYWLNQALRRDPGHQATHKVLAEYYEKKGEQDKAKVHRRQLTKPAPKAKVP
jgi:tetratricopeptide (TPR) repeat protein